MRRRRGMTVAGGVLSLLRVSRAQRSFAMRSAASTVVSGEGRKDGQAWSNNLGCSDSRNDPQCEGSKATLC